jgi:hypothetical protein
MIVEACVSLSAAWMARSPTLLAFGGDSAIELLSAGVVLVRIDPQPQAMKISLIGVRLFFRGQLDEICLHSVSELRTL